MLLLTKTGDDYEAWLAKESRPNQTDFCAGVGLTLHEACSNARTYLQAQADAANELCGLSEAKLALEVKEI